MPCITRIHTSCNADDLNNHTVTLHTFQMSSDYSVENIIGISFSFDVMFFVRITSIEKAPVLSSIQAYM